MENFITSKKIIKEIIKTNPQYVSKLYIANNCFGEDIQEIINLAKKYKISFLSVPKDKILEIFNQGYSGVLLVLSPVKYFTLEEFIQKISKKEKVVVLILDKIMDPQNFGSILRTAAAFEVDGIIIQQWNQSPITQSVINVSRGAVYNVPIVKVKNIYNAVKRLKEMNFWIYSSSSYEHPNLTISSSELSTIKNQKFVAIVLGNEEKGVRKNILNISDGIIKIKHSANIESLNVAVACGIILHELKT